MSSENRDDLRRDLGLEVQAQQAAVDAVDAAAAAYLQVNRTDLRCVEILTQTESDLPSQLAAKLGLTTGSVTAMLDLSDGVASDLARLGAASDLGARVEQVRLPISDRARRAAAELGADPYDWALRGGEEYQYMFTVPPEWFAAIPPLLGPFGVTATIIGEMGGEGRRLALADGREETMPGPEFAHFSR